ncbi:MMPL family transporter [bacterium]|nr:MMPL family transporter [bacterium]
MAWMARNHVTANLLMLFFLVGGLFSAFNIKQEVFPEFTLDAVTVSVRYPGASPAEVEQGVILAIEEAVRGVENVVEVTSTANEGSARVQIEYNPGADSQKVYQDIQQQVDRITTFPLDAEEPEVTLASRRRDVMEIQVYGEASEWALRHAAEEVRDKLLQTDGITQVELDGARDFEIHIMPDMDALRSYGMTLQDVATVVSRTAVEVPAGGIDTSGGEILVRFNERRNVAREFATIPVLTTPEGGVVLLSDVAEVREGFEDSDNFASYNGRRAIGISIYRIGDETPISVATAAREAVSTIESTLPAGIHLAINDDNSLVYRDRLRLLLKNMGMGLILVLVVLGLFLEPRLAFWVTMGIPTSFLGSFLILPFFGISLNMISMFAFIIALGIVVDDAIVVGENIHDLRVSGVPPLEAAIRGTKDVGVPVLFSVLTNCVTFIPLAFIPGTFGKIWAVIPFVVISVFTISLIESLFVLPAHIAHLSARSRNPLIRILMVLQRGVDLSFQFFIRRVFDPFMKGCIHLRYLVVAVSVAILFLMTSFALSGRMGMTLMPRVEADHSNVTATLPVGSPLHRMEAVQRRIEEAATAVAARHGGEALVTGVYSSINSNTVRSRVYLTPPDVRPLSTTAFTTEWRKEVGELVGVDLLRFEADRGGPGSGASLTVQLSHARVDRLEAAAERLGTLLADFPNVSDIDDGYQPGKRQYDFSLKPEGRSLGLTSTEVARQIRSAFEGSEAIRQQRARDEVTVRVFLPDDDRKVEYTIEQMMIRTPNGGDVPLRQIADVNRSRAYQSISRTDGRRTLNVSANVTPNDQTNQVMASLQADVLPQLMKDYPGLTWTYAGSQSDMRESIGSLGGSFILALICLYSLIAIPFKSYFQPLIVMIAIPFGVVGAICGHLLMNYSLSVISLMGIIALSGVVINSALIMIVYANEQRALGRSAFEAIHDAGIRRFRPILLTTATTFGGLAPMIFETSRQARFMIPMAISLGYGLVFATAITLLLVPSLYMIGDDISRVLGAMGRFVGAEEKPETKPVAEPTT